MFANPNISKHFFLFCQSITDCSIKHKNQFICLKCVKIWGKHWGVWSPYIPTCDVEGTSWARPPKTWRTFHPPPPHPLPLPPPLRQDRMFSHHLHSLQLVFNKVKGAASRVLCPVFFVKKNSTWAPYEKATTNSCRFCFYKDIREKRVSAESLTTLTHGKLFDFWKKI